MLKNYIRIAYRNLLKNSVFSFVNIFGLAVGMAAFLFIVQYVRFERSYEDFHKSADNIYRITLDIYNGSEFEVTDCETHAPMGPLLKEEMPEVKDFVRMFGNDGLVHIKAGTQKYMDNIYFSDPSVFSIFSYDLLHGDHQQALTDPFQAVLTKSIALKYFGRINVVGETIEIDKELYHVSAVIGDVPPNTHLKFGVLLSHSTLPKIKKWYKEDGWNGNNEYTYLLMEPGTDLAAFNRKLAARSATLVDKIDNDRYVAESVKDIHLYSNKTYEPEANGDAGVVSYLMIIAAFVITIAWVNYINLSTARAVERAREVGIRKVMGSVKAQLVSQFLYESIIVNVLAGAFAFIIFQTGLPFFRELTAQPLSLNLLKDHIFWYLFGSMLVAGSLLSGIYPAFVLASFQPVAVLKGKFRSSAHGQRLRKGLVIFQFGATVVLIICMCTVYLQVQHLRTQDLGMSIDQTLVVRAPQLDTDSVFKSSFQNFKTELLRNPGIKTVARSETLPGISMQELNTSSLSILGQNRKTGYEYYIFSIDADFIPALNMKLVAGRNFESGISDHHQVIMNEEGIRKLGFKNAEEAIGAKVSYNSATIIGVIRNYYHRSPKEEHIPMLLNYREDANYFSLRLKSQNTNETITSVKQVWENVFPGSVFDYFFLDQKYDQQYQADARFGNVMATFSGLIILIACLGLFGLSSYTIVQRTKEIGIRKVLGASVIQIVQLLSMDFAKVIITAALLALPIAYFVMKEWLAGYAVRININVWMFVLPVTAILLLALSTVGFQTIKTALSNPTDSLKQE
jgi:putative ABC transport system permease protein